MEVKIGVQHASRELSLDASQSRDEIVKSVSDALRKEGGLLVLEDAKGRTVIVPADRLAYVDLADESGRKVGFGAS
ncbi:MAG: DUF3107 domain-containing protein [Nocardioidaceae bacterium]